MSDKVPYTSQSIAGYVFVCKNCGKRHFTLFDEKPNEKVELPCKDDRFNWSQYSPNELKYYHGPSYGVAGISID